MLVDSERLVQAADRSQLLRSELKQRFTKLDELSCDAERVVLSKNFGQKRQACFTLSDPISIHAGQHERLADCALACYRKTGCVRSYHSLA